MLWNVLKAERPHTFMCIEGSGEPAGGVASGLGGAPGGGDGDSVTPASDGGGATPPLSPDNGGSDGDDPSPWAGLGEDSDGAEDAIVVPPVAVAPAAPVAPVAPVVPVAPVAPAAPAAAAPVAPVAPGVALPPQSASPSSEPAPQLSAADPVGVALAMDQSRDAVIAHLASTKYQLSEAEIAELESDAAAAVPKLLAKVQHETLTTMYRFLAQAVPGMIQKHSTVTTANDKAEEQFFAAHKGLGLKMDDPSHRKTATRIATIYRKSNPEMSLEQLIADVGPMVAASLKLQPVSQVPAVPGAPKMPAFRPAVGGGGGPAQTPAPAAQDEWSHLGQDHED